MRLEIEEINRKQPILIISKKRDVLEESLKTELTKYQTDIYISPTVPKKVQMFDYIFIRDDTVGLLTISKLSYKRIIFIKTDPQLHTKRITSSIQTGEIENTKMIDITFTAVNQELIEKILWFSFSKTQEAFLNLSSPPKKMYITSKKKRVHLRKLFQIKPLLFTVLALFITVTLLFLPFLVGATYQTYRASLLVRQEKIDETEYALDISSHLLGIAKNLYRLPRPVFSVFSVSLWFDNIIDINEKAEATIQVALSLQKNGQRFTELLFKKVKSPAEYEEIQLRIIKMKNDLDTLEDDLIVLQQKIPSYNEKAKKLKDELSDSIEVLSKLKKLLAYTDTFLAKNTEKKYLLLFANNMELRPGGGFIGSFGIMTIKNFTLTDLKIYDVYDADGQLKSHIEPPTALKKYLSVQHWFLRDSAFSADFLTNYTQAKFFLDKEINERNFSGAILITTTAVQNMLSAFPNIYLPDFNEYVNDKNFYIKTQYYAEKDFFPGSTQKKGFLSSLTRNLFINIQSASTKELLQGLKKSLDEKQIVTFIDHPPLQEILDSFYWSGRMIEPRCTNSEGDCVVDYLFPIDSNVGGNKANFFITRTMHLAINIDKDGNIKHKLTIQFKNDSYADVYPGGIYRNYFQLLVPKGSVIKTMTQDGVQIDDTDESETDFRRIGMEFMVKPKKTTTIEITYQIPQKLPKGRTHYQLIVQKQIGSSNNDFNLELSLPSSIHPISQNFSPLVKNDRLIYNTSVGADKIFYLELLKE